MRLAALVLLAVVCASANAQTPATKPVKPTAPSVAKPTPAKPAIVQAAKPADLPKLQASLQEAEAKQAELEKKKSEAGGLNADDMALLEKAMASKSALESMISGVLKKATDSQKPATSALKGS